MDRGKKRYMRFYFLVLISQMFDTIVSCPASIPTISYVSFCPKNQEEWKKAAKLKNCESIAVIQNCTAQNNFQYHCLMNQWKNATLEVCAPIFYLQGFCAEYNIRTKGVAEIYDKGFECLKFSDTHTTCPRRYPSNEAYKYQRCYRYKNEAEAMKPSSKDNSVIALVFILIALLLFGFVSLVIVMLRKGICDALFIKGCRWTNTDSKQNKRFRGETEENRLLTVERNDKDVEAEEIPTTNKEKEKQRAYISDENSGIDTKEHININTKDTSLPAKAEVFEKKTAEKRVEENDHTKEPEDIVDSKKSSLNDTSTQGEKQRVKSKKAPQPPTVQPNKTENKESGEKDSRTVDDKETVCVRKNPAPPRPPQPVNHTSEK